jgi:predicted PurR-regulated permease PerM
VPEWVPQLPGIGYPLEEWWRSNLSDPKAAEELLGRIYARVPAASAREVAGEIIHRLILFGFTLLTLFFLFRDGAAVSRRLIGLSDRLLGAQGERIGRHMMQAVLGTVNGLVLVGLGEGVLLGIAYILAGLPHPVSFAVLTGILAVIPFGAPVVFGAAALYLAAAGSAAAAAAVFGFGVAVVFVADHFVRPVLIGGAVRLPFLWVLLGILGGLETFGILGLFLGPAVMAALISLWREWTEAAPQPIV